MTPIPTTQNATTASTSTTETSVTTGVSSPSNTTNNVPSTPMPFYKTGVFIASVTGGTLVLISIIIIVVTICKFRQRKKKNADPAEKDGKDNVSNITPDNLSVSDGKGRRPSNFQNYGYSNDEYDNDSENWTAMSPNRLPRQPWQTQIPDTFHPYPQKERGPLPDNYRGSNNTPHKQHGDIYYTSPNDRFENEGYRSHGNDYHRQQVRRTDSFQNSPPRASSPRPDFSHHNYMGEVIPKKRFSYLGAEGSPMSTPPLQRRSVLERNPSRKEQGFGVSPPKRSSHMHDMPMVQGAPRHDSSHDKRSRNPSDSYPPMDYILEDQPREQVPVGQPHAARPHPSQRGSVHPDAPHSRPHHEPPVFDDREPQPPRMPHSKRGSSMYREPPQARQAGPAYDERKHYASPDYSMPHDPPHGGYEPLREQYPSNKHPSMHANSSHSDPPLDRYPDRYPHNKRASAYGDSPRHGYMNIDEYPPVKDPYNKGAPHPELDSNWQFGSSKPAHWTSGKVLY